MPTKSKQIPEWLFDNASEKASYPRWLPENLITHVQEVLELEEFGIGDRVVFTSAGVSKLLNGYVPDYDIKNFISDYCGKPLDEKLYTSDAYHTAQAYRTLKSWRLLIKALVSEDQDCKLFWQKAGKSPNAGQILDSLHHEVSVLDYWPEMKARYEHRKQFFDSLTRRADALAYDISKYFALEIEDEELGELFLKTLQPFRQQIAKYADDAREWAESTPVSHKRYIDTYSAISCTKKLVQVMRQYFAKPLHREVAALVNAMFGTVYSQEDVKQLTRKTGAYDLV